MSLGEAETSSKSSKVGIQESRFFFFLEDREVETGIRKGHMWKIQLHVECFIF